MVHAVEIRTSNQWQKNEENNFDVKFIWAKLISIFLGMGC